MRLFDIVCFAYTFYSIIDVDKSYAALFNNPKIGVCSGSANGLGSTTNSPAKVIQNLRDMYENCTLVTGNLEIVGINEQHYKEANISSLDFLQDIEEVIGYVLIMYNHVETISLPKLKIIRGESTFKNDLMETYSLLVGHNPRLKQLNLPNLRLIQFGNVRELVNDRLCYWDTIDWTQIVGADQTVYSSNNNFSHCSYAGNVTEACSQCKNPHCWGSRESDCQIIYRNGCPSYCSSRMCYNGECCDKNCAGGCTGRTTEHCVGCLEFRMNKTCVSTCPPPTKYNAKTKVRERNPDGMYHLSHECVKECPKNMVIDGDSCVSRCSEGFMVKTFERSPGIKTRECVQCEKFCPKTCVVTEKISPANIHNFTNCTVVDGFIEIRQDPFSEKNHTAVLTVDHLMELSSVQVVTQYVFIQVDHPSFSSLKFLRNLERIEGRGLFKNEFGLYISHTSLRSLDLVNLKEVMAGALFLNMNSQLCYVQNIPWQRIVVENAKKWNFASPYRDPKLCQRFQEVCDRRCNLSLGCWGPGNDSCYACKDWKLDGICIDDCSSSEGRYVLNETTRVCDICHPLCKDGCIGPLTSDCNNCTKVRQDGECAEVCRNGTYVDENHICQPCNPACDVRQGCTGPLDTLGIGGCNKCFHGLLTSDRKKIAKCLPKEAVQRATCYGFESYFAHFPDTTYLHESVAHEVCQKCHTACRSCSSYGTDKIQNGCKCARFLDGITNTTCLTECSRQSYLVPTGLIGGGVCYPCHPECDGCYKSSNSSCNACRNFKLFTDPTNTTKFVCTSDCPPEKPFADPQRICTVAKKTFNREQITKVSGAVAGVFLVILLIAAAVIYYFRKRLAVIEKKQAEEEHEFLEKPMPPLISPNLHQLLIINENYLDRQDELGSGAFGAVYKGTYSPPEMKGKKLPVAIKVIREENEDANAPEEMLEEAKIMASMEHRNLVRLVGICIGSEVMLVTPLMPLGSLLEFVQKNQGRITSKTLLTWGQQIAEGMAYLEEHRLVHRDLAARNVLVKKPLLVKITDFGLAKMLDYDENSYKSRGGKLPVKWLALECIKSGQFTHKSDVWAFGVTMWELFTFGERPYFEIRIDDVPQILEKGERLPQPSICTIDVFLVIIKCWMKDPMSRPSFLDLADCFARWRQDPCRYLVIPWETEGDKLLRMESYTVEENKRRLRDLVDLDEDEVLEEEDLYRDESEPNSPSSPSKPLLEGCVERRVMNNFGHRTPSTGSQRYGPEPVRKRSKNAKSSGYISDADNYLTPNTLMVADSPSSSSYVPYTTVISGSPVEDGCFNGVLPHDYINEMAKVNDYLMPNSMANKISNGRLSSTSSSCGFDNNEYLQSPRTFDGVNSPLLRKPLLPAQFFDESFMEKESTV